MMESKQQNVKSAGKNHIMDSSGTKESHLYEDDFEELDSFIKETRSNSSKSKSSTKKDVFHNGEAQSDTEAHVEKGQRESSGQMPMEKDKKTQGAPPAYEDVQSDDSEPEQDGEVMFTEDQQRAMMELMAQKHDSGDYTGDPPEYNVKERLKELNAELAREPDPDDREHRVGFKKELVDLVAPPPEISDDDEDKDSPEKTLADADQGATNNSSNNNSKASDRENNNNEKQYVVERDGKFDFVTSQELSATERAMFDIPPDDGADKSEDRNSQARREQGMKSGGGGGGGGGSSASRSKENLCPQPPSRPRPSSAAVSSSRRNNAPHVAQSPRPRTASSSNSRSNNTNYGSALQDFSYNSPYAMSSTEKERAQERARLREQQKKEEERRRQEEEEYRRQESEDAFQAWLRHKSDDDRKRRQADEDQRRRTGREDKSKESEEAFQGWLRQKQAQQRREKLLKRREDQGVKETYYVRSREECNTAYKEWLKKKYTEFRQQRAAEKERQRTVMAMARRNRKQQMIVRALRHSPAFRYSDIYGNRF
ncbi:uncharacterized protein LOC143298019 isoform X2 [Babylonia areolata]|uniref:uncharacterized protein LOC143298019 isoform X2 n=1 Tax=Babylonia areolata TaxID=304850 RepID=UPI003FD1C932